MTTESQMIEVMAMAIQTEFGNRSGKGKPWHRLTEKIRDDYRSEARAALNAARELKRADRSTASRQALARSGGARDV
jgi:hypothetical protein